MAQFDEEKQNKRFLELREHEAEELAQVLAKKHGLPYLDLTSVTIDLDTLKLIPEADAREGKIAAFQSVGRKLSVALLNPDTLKAKAVLEDLKSKKFDAELFLVSPGSLEKAFSRYAEIPAFEEVKTALIDVSNERLKEYESKSKTVSSFKGLLASAGTLQETRKISEVLEMVLAGALALEASDIHIEPGENQAELRIRLDGVLQEVAALPTKVYQHLLSRIKLLSELKLNIKNKAQDGRFTIRTEGTDIEVRTATLPGPYVLLGTFFKVSIWTTRLATPFAETLTAQQPKRRSVSRRGAQASRIQIRWSERSSSEGGASLPAGTIEGSGIRMPR